MRRNRPPRPRVQPAAQASPLKSDERYRFWLLVKLLVIIVLGVVSIINLITANTLSNEARETTNEAYWQDVRTTQSRQNLAIAHRLPVTSPTAPILRN